jgi:hypothetical protein
MVPQWLINTKSRLRLVEIARKFAVPQKPRYHSYYNNCLLSYLEK